MKKTAISLLLVLSLCSCSAPVKSGADIENFRSDILKARDSLLAYPDYIMSNTYEMPYGVMTSLSIRHNDIQYIEYPITSEGQVESRSFEAGGKYGLSEYRMNDGNWYQFTSDTDVLRLPESYGDYRDDMRVLYIDKILDCATDISRGTDVEMQTSYGAETFSTYNLYVSSDIMKILFGLPSYGMFASARDDTRNKDIKQYAGWVVDDFDSLYTYSDTSRLVVMVDNQGRLRGISVEAKGGGGVSYYTSVVVSFDNQNVRDTPDISNSSSFMLSLMSAASATADARSYEEALGILNQLNEQVENSSGGD